MITLLTVAHDHACTFHDGDYDEADDGAETAKHNLLHLTSEKVQYRRNIRRRGEARVG